MNFLSRGISILVLTAGWAVGGTALTSSEVDSSLGKPVTLVQAWTLPTYYHAVQADSSLGKPVVFRPLTMRPPLSSGIGYRFNQKQYFYIYSDKASGANHFAPSGWMGDYADLTLDDEHTGYPADGRTCLKVSYTPASSASQGWAGIYWQQPVNNWGDKNGGFNLEGMRRLTFWVRGEKGNEHIDVFKVGGIEGAKPDSGESEIGPIDLTQQWAQYAIDLRHVDLSKLSGGFAWATNAVDNPAGVTFYLDEIRFER